MRLTQGTVNVGSFVGLRITNHGYGVLSSLIPSTVSIDGQMTPLSLESTLSYTSDILSLSPSTMIEMDIDVGSSHHFMTSAMGEMAIVTTTKYGLASGNTVMLRGTLSDINTVMTNLQYTGVIYDQGYMNVAHLQAFDYAKSTSTTPLHSIVADLWVNYAISGTPPAIAFTALVNGVLSCAEAELCQIQFTVTDPNPSTDVITVKFTVGNNAQYGGVGRDSDLIGTQPTSDEIFDTIEFTGSQSDINTVRYYYRSVVNPTSSDPTDDYVSLFITNSLGYLNYLIPVHIALVNDAPVVNGPSIQSVSFQVISLLPGYSITDGDSYGNQETITIFAKSGFIAFGDEALQNTNTDSLTHTITVTDTIANINALLPTLHYISQGIGSTDVLTITVNDNGFSGSGGAQTTVYTGTIFVYYLAPVLLPPTFTGVTETTVTFTVNSVTASRYGSVVGYEAAYSTDLENWVSSTQSFTATTSDTTVLSTTVDNLLPFVIYAFRVRVITQRVTDTTSLPGPWSFVDSTVFQTYDSDPSLQLTGGIVRTVMDFPNPPTGFSASKVGSSSMVLSWTRPVYTGGASTVQYRLDYTAPCDNTDTVICTGSISAIDGSPYLLTNLHSGTEYHLALFTTNARGVSPDSIEIDVVTLSPTPQIIEFTAMIDQTTTNIDFKVGSQISLTFDVPTNKPSMDQSSFLFTDSVGDLSCEWISSWTVVCTSLDTSNFPQDFETRLEVGVSTVTILESAGLRSGDLLSLLSTSTSPVLDGQFGVYQFHPIVTYATNPIIFENGFTITPLPLSFTAVLDPNAGDDMTTDTVFKMTLQAANPSGSYIATAAKPSVPFTSDSPSKVVLLGKIAELSGMAAPLVYVPHNMHLDKAHY